MSFHIQNVSNAEVIILDFRKAIVIDLSSCWIILYVVGCVYPASETTSLNSTHFPDKQQHINYSSRNIGWLAIRQTHFFSFLAHSDYVFRVFLMAYMAMRLSSNKWNVSLPNPGRESSSAVFLLSLSITTSAVWMSMSKAKLEAICGRWWSLHLFEPLNDYVEQSITLIN